MLTTRRTTGGLELRGVMYRTSMAKGSYDVGKVVSYYLLLSNPPRPPVQLPISPSANKLERGPSPNYTRAYLRFPFSLVVTAP